MLLEFKNIPRAMKHDIQLRAETDVISIDKTSVEGTQSPLDYDLLIFSVSHHVIFSVNIVS